MKLWLSTVPARASHGKKGSLGPLVPSRFRTAMTKTTAGRKKMHLPFRRYLSGREVRIFYSSEARIVTRAKSLSLLKRVKIPNPTSDNIYEPNGR